MTALSPLKRNTVLGTEQNQVADMASPNGEAIQLLFFSYQISLTYEPHQLNL